MFTSFLTWRKQGATKDHSSSNQGMDFGQLLAASLSPDQKVRGDATQVLKHAEADNFAVYVSSLCLELCEERNKTDIRQSAGVILKNTLIAKDPQQRQLYTDRWLHVEERIRAQLKERLLNTLGTGDIRAGTTIAQVVAALANVELPAKQWPQLMSSLLEMSQKSGEEMRRRFAIESIGFICEEVDPEILSSHSNDILTAVVSGLRVEEVTVVRAASARAMLNSLEFIGKHFEMAMERDVIVRAVCTATQASDPGIVIPAFECLTRMMQLYYEVMETYMQQGVAQLTVRMLSLPSEAIVLQAIEFWATVCDIERDMQTDSPEADLSYCKKTLHELLPALLHLLMQQHSEEDTDEWNVSMAAASCLSLLAENVKDDIFIGGIVPNFITSNINGVTWREREAALMVFGSVMDGPEGSLVQQMVQQGVLILLPKATSDPSVAVRDTAAWAIGRLVDFFNHVIESSLIPTIIQVLQQGLGDASRVAVNCCWSLMSLYVHFGSNDLSDCEGELVAPYVEGVCDALFAAAQRGDSDESNLRTAAYQSLANVVQFAPNVCSTYIRRLQGTIIQALQKSQAMAEQILSVEDSMNYSDLQGHLCCVLQNTVKKLGKPEGHLADVIFMAILRILENAQRGKGSATEVEDVLLLVGTLVDVMEGEMQRFIPDLMPFVISATSNTTAAGLCTVCVGVLGDVAHALAGTQVLNHYADIWMARLLQALTEPQMDRNVKPHVVSAIGDMALALGTGGMSKYIHPTMEILSGAAGIKVQDKDDYDEIDFVCALREALLETLTAIVQGLRDDTTALNSMVPYVPAVMQFIGIVAGDGERTEGMVKSALGLIGDLATVYPQEMRQLLTSGAGGWVQAFVMSQNPQDLETLTRQILLWTRKTLQDLCAN